MQVLCIRTRDGTDPIPRVGIGPTLGKMGGKYDPEVEKERWELIGFGKITNKQCEKFL